MTNDLGKRRYEGRLEDDDLLRGLGRFSDDLRQPDTAFACFVRSPHAFARIRGVNLALAKATPGVLAVLTASDLAAQAYGSVTVPYPLSGTERIVAPYRPPLAADRVMHVGELVAVVVGDNPDIAQDAAERVEIDYQTIAPVINTVRATEPGASQLWPEAPNNVALDYSAPVDTEGSNQAAVERCLASADHIASVELMNQRIAAVSLEPRGATAMYDTERNVLTLHCGSQGVAQIQRELCRCMGLSPEQIRVVTNDVGGGFGMKASPYPEYVVLLHATRLLKRPIHWIATRGEAFQTDNQARDSFWTGQLALDRNGRFLALRVAVTANIGAYLTGVGHYCSTRHVAECLPSIYNIRFATLQTRCAFTNTAPTGPYRGAGRPEANYFLERLIDRAAELTGIDRAELRRRNMIAASELPITTVFGNTYDSGDFPAMFDKALQLADYAGFADRRVKSKQSGILRGIGIGCYLENSGAFPQESVRLSFSGGRVRVSIGAGSSGQGHRTVFGHVVSRRLGVPTSAVEITSGDSVQDVPGFGAVASRSAMMVGGAIANAIDTMLDKGGKTAALLMQTEPQNIVYSQGAFHVKDREQTISIFELAERAVELRRQEIIAEDLTTIGQVAAPSSFPNGCHIAEVAIDPETGVVSLASYVAVDDCGNILDARIVEGQIHGGIAQGAGQALLERVVYDDDSGQLISGSFMDYGMPRASLFPDIKTAHHSIPCTTNPLGVKGVGEAGTTAAPCAIMNAVADALPSKIKIQMPATAESIWRALSESKANSPYMAQQP